VLHGGLKLLQALAAGGLLVRIWSLPGQWKIFNRDLSIFTPSDGLPPGGQDLETGDLERQRQQIFHLIKGRILFVQDQKNLLGDVVRTFPNSRCREAEDPFAQQNQYLASFQAFIILRPTPYSCHNNPHAG